MLREGQKSALKKLSNISNIDGKKILEIGGDLKHELADCLIDMGASHVTSINISPEVSTQKVSDRLSIVNLDATKLLSHFESETFDMVFGVAVLEHIHNTQLLLDQIYSVLKPIGTALLHGGPIWTSAIGHHVWIEYDQKKYLFNDKTNPIPDWHHLILNFNEMIDFLTTKKKLKRQHAIQIAKYIYKDTNLSRVSYLDYINIFKQSKFRTIMIYEEYGKQIPKHIMKKLKSTHYKNQEDFEVIALQFIVEK